jgi:hypothetical protein
MFCEGISLIRSYFARKVALESIPCITLKGLSHEIDFKNVVENGQILALIRAAAGF